MLKNKRAFSIIEILIGMFIFTLWLISVYAIISSSVKMNEYNKNYIIASHLAREQLEILRNNRDYNYEKLQKFDQINPHGWDYNDVFLDDTKYKIENKVRARDSFPIQIEELSNLDFLNDDNYQLCLDSNNMYVYCSEWLNLRKTFFYKYIVTDVLDTNTLRFTSKVIWKARWIHEFEVKTILSDWKQL